MSINNNIQEDFKKVFMNKKLSISLRIDGDTYLKLLKLCRKFSKNTSETIRMCIRSTYELFKDVESIEDKQIVIQNPIIQMSNNVDEKSIQCSEECNEYREMSIMLLSLIMCYNKENCKPMKIVNYIKNKLVNMKNPELLRNEAEQLLEKFMLFK